MSSYKTFCNQKQEFYCQIFDTVGKIWQICIQQFLLYNLVSAHKSTSKVLDISNYITHIPCCSMKCWKVCAFILIFYLVILAHSLSHYITVFVVIIISAISLAPSRFRDHLCTLLKGLTTQVPTGCRRVSAQTHWHSKHNKCMQMKLRVLAYSQQNCSAAATST